MAMTQSEWYRALDPEKRREIRRLHRIEPAWNLVGLLFIAIWAATGYAVVHAPVWYLRIPGYVLISLVIHGMSNFMHEGIHGTLFRHKHLDRLFGFVMGAPSMFTVTAYGVNHLLHHKHTRTDHDPDDIRNFTTDPRRLSLLYYLWLLFGMTFYVGRVSWVAMSHGTPAERTRMVTERLILTVAALGLLAASWWCGFFGVVMQVWIIPLLIASFYGNVRGWAEHTLTAPGHPLTITRTVTSNPLFSFLNINLNYHLEHHLFPGVPWYNLPKVHRLLLDDYRAAGASVYRSYARFLYDAFRTGINGPPLRPEIGGRLPA
jgi:fatty acid desaturase